MPFAADTLRLGVEDDVADRVGITNAGAFGRNVTRTPVLEIMAFRRRAGRLRHKFAIYCRDVVRVCKLSLLKTFVKLRGALSGWCKLFKKNCLAKVEADTSLRQKC